MNKKGIKNTSLLLLILFLFGFSSCISMLTDIGVSSILGYSSSMIDNNMKTLDPDASYTKRASTFLTLMGDEAKMQELAENNPGIVDAVLGSKRDQNKKVIITTPDYEMPAYLVYPDEIKDDKLYPVIMFSHGGGFELWDFSKYESFCANLANKCDAVVFFYEFRKAPKFKFPYGVNDTFEAYRWIINDANCALWNLDSSRIVLAGDSSGGNFMAGLSIRILEEGLKSPCGVLLLYPSLDVSRSFNYSRLAFSGLEEGAPVFVDDFRYLVSVSNKYLEKPEDAYKPYASPLIMLEGLLEVDGFDNPYKDYKAKLSLPLQLPEHLICVPQVDSLRDEGKMYHAMLRILGAKSTLIEYKGMFHGFTLADIAFYQAEECINDSADFINRLFYAD